LSDDRNTVRFAVPSVAVPGMPEPIRVLVEFDAEDVDEMLKRPIVLRARMPEPWTQIEARSGSVGSGSGA
jgi:hypothetical protein